MNGTYRSKRGPVEGCPQPESDDERTVMPQLAAFDAIFGVGSPFGDALAAAEARADRIHAALEASRDDR